MAVQAQYPSNVLLLNRNNQEGNDYSLHPQQGGLILDQTHILFNNGSGNNPRKRGRESCSAAMETITSTPNNMFSLNQSHQLIDLSLLHNRQQKQQPNVVSTGLRLSSGDQQHQTHEQLHQNQHHFPQQQQNNLAFQSTSVFSLLSDDSSSQIKQQRSELDRFLQAQGEQLRRRFAKQRQNLYRNLLGAAEESIARQLREKEAEIEKARCRNTELEARAAQLSMEAQVWQAKTRAQEATAASLQAQLQEALKSGSMLGAQDKRGGSGEGLECPGGVDVQAQDAESAYIDPDRAISGPNCKSCWKRAASAVLLPCRHLCVCTDCEQVVQACPLCLSFRNSSVEVYLC